jgi:hypothetical protein
MPRQQAILRRETCHAEHFDCLIGEQRCEDGRRCAWVLQNECRHAHDAAFGVAQRTIRADEFAHAVSASAGNERN